MRQKLPRQLPLVPQGQVPLLHGHAGARPHPDPRPNPSPSPSPYPDPDPNPNPNQALKDYRDAKEKETAREAMVKEKVAAPTAATEEESLGGNCPKFVGLPGADDANPKFKRWAAGANNDEYIATLCYERADSFLTWLKARPEKSIAVVAHWVFLKHVFTAHASDSSLATNFRNAELRTAALFAGSGKVEL